MHFRKFISAWALLALMVAQVALSQHNAIHIDHGFEAYNVISHSSDVDHKDQQQNKHECPECLLVKSLQTAFYNTPVVLLVDAVSKVSTLPQEHIIFVQGIYNANSPRAPPAILV